MRRCNANGALDKEAFLTYYEEVNKMATEMASSPHLSAASPEEELASLGI